MTYLYIILWLIFGILATMNLYYSFLKDWYLDFKTDYRLYDNGSGVINKIKFYAMIIIPCGVISFILIAFFMFLFLKAKSFTYYFKIPKQ